MQNKQLKNKELFLTYEGILRVIFNSENNKTKGFVKWATETLFTVQMGEEEDKDTLASSLLGTTYKVVKQVFRCNSKTTPCIYLLIVKEEDNKLICKYGFTKDLVRRMKEHNLLFKKEFGKEPTLLYYGVIDIMYMSEAENNLSSYFKNYKYNYKTFDELITVDKTELNNVKMIYESMENKYIGRYEEMKNNMNDMRLEIIELNNKLKSIDIEHKHTLELLQEKHNLELYKKENEFNAELLELYKKENEFNNELYKKENEYNNELYKKDAELLKMESEIKSLKDKLVIELQQKDIDILKKELEMLKTYKKIAD